MNTGYGRIRARERHAALAGMRLQGVFTAEQLKRYHQEGEGVCGLRFAAEFETETGFAETRFESLLRSR
jgi:hypothetical protein